MTILSENVVVLKEYGSDFVLVAISDHTTWLQGAKIQLARRRVTGESVVFEKESMDRSPAYREIEKALRSLGLNVCP